MLVIEIELYTTWRTQFDPHTLVFYFTGLQLLIGILPLILSRNLRFSTDTPWKIARGIPLSIASVYGIFYAYRLLKPLFEQVPIKVSNSDIIPQIQRFCKEFLAGRFPYTPFGDFGYLMSPTYLPAQWLPYLPMDWLKLDPRMLTFSVFALIYGVFAAKIIQHNTAFLKAIVLLAMPIYLIFEVFTYESPVWSLSVEQLIMGYYLLLGISLTTESRPFQIFSIVLCLMSRFALIFWLPLFIFMMWTKQGTRTTLTYCAWIFAGCAVLYAPFLLKDPYIFTNAQAYYDLATERCWAEPKPSPVYNGLAFTIYFFEKTGNKAQLIAELKQMLFIITPSVSLLFGWIWWRVKDKIDAPLFAICTLKISLAVFYAFIQIPFSYLYITPIIMSSVVLYRFGHLRHKL
ncbi:MAG: hypothetical protein U5L45_23370 [Saprospiraceae bacterium]|nr:hypothetical protein [Saprospiraceae bacterium]